MFGTSVYATAMMLAPAPAAQDAAPPAEAAVTPPIVAAPLLTAPPAPHPEGEIVVEGRKGGGTPIEQVNVESFAVAQEIDEAVFGPVARAYGKSVPRPIRKGLRNVLTNLREPIVAANYLLQLKVGKAGETLGRFAINSTIGVAGLIDQAKRKPFNLPRRRNSFANTLGFYGVKPGPFFYLPLIGATTLRDLFGNVVDQLAVPHVTVKPFNQSQYMAPIGVLSALDARFEFEEELQERRAGRDPYGTTKQIYLDRRQAEIDALRAPRGVKVGK
jgi:phospholipid-binding lipoprotein MlaA